MQGKLLPALAEEELVPLQSAISVEPIASHPVPAQMPSTFALVLNHRMILFTILLVFGPLGLPLIWMSPRFSVWMKLLVTTTTIGITIIFPIAMTLYWADYALQPLLEAMQTANGVS